MNNGKWVDVIIAASNNSQQLNLFQSLNYHLFQKNLKENLLPGISIFIVCYRQSIWTNYGQSKGQESGVITREYEIFLLKSSLSWLKQKQEEEKIRKQSKSLSTEKLKPRLSENCNFNTNLLKFIVTFTGLLCKQCLMTKFQKIGKINHENR